MPKWKNTHCKKIEQLVSGGSNVRKKIPFLIVSIIVFIIGCISIYPDQASRIMKQISNSIKSNGFFNSILTRDTSIDSDNLADFLENVAITDSDGNSIKDNTLHVGSKYNITISFLIKAGRLF